MDHIALKALTAAIAKISARRPKLGAALSCLKMQQERTTAVSLEICGDALRFNGGYIRGLTKRELEASLATIAKRALNQPRDLRGHRYGLLPFAGQYGETTFLPLRDYALDYTPASVSLRFFNLIDEVVTRIAHSEAVVGCCPWISSPRILAALNETKHYSIVSALDAHRPKIHEAFTEKFPIGLAERLQAGDVDLAFKDWSNARSVEYILSAGEKGEKQPVQRLHSKFLIFLDRVDNEFVAKEVAFGSLNYTDNGDLQHEMLSFIQSPMVCETMLLQWYQMLVLAGYQRNPDLVHFAYDTSAENEHNERNGESDFYAGDLEAALFDHEAYLDGRITRAVD